MAGKDTPYWAPHWSKAHCGAPKTMGYNALLDPHLVGYLDSKTMFRNLRKAGLVDKNKRVKDEDELRQWHLRRNQRERIKEDITKSIIDTAVSRRRLIEAQNQKEIERQIIQDRVQEIKRRRALKGGEITRQIKKELLFGTGRASASAPSGRQYFDPLDADEDDGEEFPEGVGNDDGAQQLLASLMGGSTDAPLSLSDLHGRAGKGKKTGKGKKSGKARSRPETSAGAGGRRTKRRPRLANSAALLSRRQLQQANAKVTLKYTGAPMMAAATKANEPVEVVVQQQHCGGANATAFRGHLLPGDVFSFESKRNKAFPFGATLFANGLQLARLSACCEYKYDSGKYLGGRTSGVRMVRVDHGKPCMECEIKRLTLKRNLTKPGPTPFTMPPLDYTRDEDEFPLGPADDENETDDDHASPGSDANGEDDGDDGDEEDEGDDGADDDAAEEQAASGDDSAALPTSPEQVLDEALDALDGTADNDYNSDEFASSSSNDDSDGAEDDDAHVQAVDDEGNTLEDEVGKLDKLVRHISNESLLSNRSSQESLANLPAARKKSIADAQAILNSILSAVPEEDAAQEDKGKRSLPKEMAPRPEPKSRLPAEARRPSLPHPPKGPRPATAATSLRARFAGLQKAGKLDSSSSTAPSKRPTTAPKTVLPVTVETPPSPVVAPRRPLESTATPPQAPPDLLNISSLSTESLRSDQPSPAQIVLPSPAITPTSGRTPEPTASPPKQEPAASPPPKKRTPSTEEVLLLAETLSLANSHIDDSSAAGGVAHGKDAEWAAANRSTGSPTRVSAATLEAARRLSSELLMQDEEEEEEEEAREGVSDGTFLMRDDRLHGRLTPPTESEAEAEGEGEGENEGGRRVGTTTGGSVPRARSTSPLLYGLSESEDEDGADTAAAAAGPAARARVLAKTMEGVLRRDSMHDFDVPAARTEARPAEEVEAETKEEEAKETSEGARVMVALHPITTPSVRADTRAEDQAVEREGREEEENEEEKEEKEEEEEEEDLSRPEAATATGSDEEGNDSDGAVEVERVAHRDDEPVAADGPQEVQEETESEEDLQLISSLAKGIAASVVSDAIVITRRNSDIGLFEQRMAATDGQLRPVDGSADANKAANNDEQAPVVPKAVANASSADEPSATNAKPDEEKASASSAKEAAAGDESKAAAKEDKAAAERPPQKAFPEGGVLDSDVLDSAVPDGDDSEAGDGRESKGSGLSWKKPAAIVPPKAAASSLSSLPPLPGMASSRKAPEPFLPMRSPSPPSVDIVSTPVEGLRSNLKGGRRRASVAEGTDDDQLLADRRVVFDLPSPNKNAAGEAGAGEAGPGEVAQMAADAGAAAEPVGSNGSAARARPPLVRTARVADDAGAAKDLVPPSADSSTSSGSEDEDEDDAFGPVSSSEPLFSDDDEDF